MKVKPDWDEDERKLLKKVLDDEFWPIESHILSNLTSTDDMLNHVSDNGMVCG